MAILAVSSRILVVTMILLSYTLVYSSYTPLVYSSYNKTTDCTFYAQNNHLSV